MLATNDLQLLIHTADSGSLSQAARLLGILPATASASLKRIEQRLNTRLFARSTRSMRLTADGEIFLAYCRDALALLTEGEHLLSSSKAAIGGHLRLSMPSDIGRNVLVPWLNEFQDEYRDVRLTLQFSDRIADLFRDAIDVAIRSGPLEDSSLVSQQLAIGRRVLVAAPSYLDKRGTPQSPADLRAHNCLLFYLKQGLFNQWRFFDGRQHQDIKVQGDRMTDDAAIAREWAVAAKGIAYKSWIDVRSDVRAGRLITVLDSYTQEPIPLNAVYPHRNSASPTVRALLKYLRQRFDQLHGADETVTG
ncbi:DNA-binding transcriptional LysR family regulator [Herbaspirillum sp. Sphag1AN]|uniref:LysR family transcriptional regulator n=1 Tax=unclassified Herbaspirillum TaxID=2624150 RepID=UPI00161E21E3|nr:MULTISPECIES: LysR family transcriptional regulator [unclassified Herbaspirillum]MBB3212129.1 DNA-binding transcriptional LysR family regulator [Herbaspirillum sp. Sphag1AN]MBB3244037.1 DNA-binding transcriptional LysR family regulator [Herbaspirillum sp. Sphag64]